MKKETKKPLKAAIRNQKNNSQSLDSETKISTNKIEGVKAALNPQKNTKNIFSIVLDSLLSIRKIKFKTIDDDYQFYFPYYDNKITSIIVFCITFMLGLFFGSIGVSLFLASVGSLIVYKYFMKGAYVWTILFITIGLPYIASAS